jgi:hypothetical protein
MENFLSKPIPMTSFRIWMNKEEEDEERSIRMQRMKPRRLLPPVEEGKKDANAAASSAIQEYNRSQMELLKTVNQMLLQSNPATAAHNGGERGSVSRSGERKRGEAGHGSTPAPPEAKRQRRTSSSCGEEDERYHHPNENNRIPGIRETPWPSSSFSSSSFHRRSAAPSSRPPPVVIEEVDSDEEEEQEGHHHHPYGGVSYYYDNSSDDSSSE